MRTPFGAKARLPTEDGRSSDLGSLLGSFLPAMMKAVLPADQAVAPSGPVVTESIQRRLASVAMVLLSPLASVETTLPSSPPVTMREPSLATERMPPE